MIVNHMKSISKKSLIKILVFSIFILCVKSLKAQSFNEIDKAIKSENIDINFNPNFGRKNCNVPCSIQI